MRKKILVMVMTAAMAVTGFSGSTAKMTSASAVDSETVLNQTALKNEQNIHIQARKAAKKKNELTSAQILAKMKKSMKSSYTCDQKLTTEDGLKYYELDKNKVVNMAYEANSNSSINMDVAIVVKVKKGYANTAKSKFQKSLTQLVDYNKLYNMDTLRVNQARIFVKDNYVGMFILGKRADYKLSVQKQAKTAKTEAAKIDKAWKLVFGGSTKNLAKIK